VATWPRNLNRPKWGPTKVMPFKFIVKIEKNGIAMEVEVMARTAREAQETATRMYTGYRTTGIQWRINPSDGNRILCS
jgi:hypothetical protein